MSENQTYCIIDQVPITHARALRGSVTCSPECAKKLAKARRAMIDARRCRQCNVPSTPEERKQFAQWRRDTGQFGKSGRPAGAKNKPKEQP